MVWQCFPHGPKAMFQPGRYPKCIITVAAIKIKNGLWHPGHAAALSFIIPQFWCPFRCILEGSFMLGRTKLLCWLPDIPVLEFFVQRHTQICLSTVQRRDNGEYLAAQWGARLKMSWLLSCQRAVWRATTSPVPTTGWSWLSISHFIPISFHVIPHNAVG